MSIPAQRVKCHGKAEQLGFDEQQRRMLNQAIFHSLYVDDDQIADHSPSHNCTPSRATGRPPT
jgi:hypothetical protein